MEARRRQTLLAAGGSASVDGMREVTETELRACFVNATPRELQQLPIPGLHETIWAEREYLGADQR